MKTVVAICCAVALFQVSVEAQWLPSMTSMIPGNTGRIISAMASIHSALSKTPLAPFLPGPGQMAMDVLALMKNAKNVNDAIQKAGTQMNNMIQQAAQQARIPMADLSQLTSQMQNTLSTAINQVGSAPPPQQKQ